jgi:hypothetical protein
MSIRPSPGPNVSNPLQIVAKAITDILPSSPGTGGAIRSVSGALQKFSIALSDIGTSDYLSKAHPSGWQYLISDSGLPIATADLNSDPSGGAKAGAITSGELPDRVQEATALADSLYKNTPEVYEARILEIPGLYFVALWLHADTDDKFFPILEGTARDASIVREDPSFLQRLEQAAKDRSANP